MDVPWPQPSFRRTLLERERMARRLPRLMRRGVSGSRRTRRDPPPAGDGRLVSPRRCSCALPNREMDPARGDERLARVPPTLTQLAHPPEKEADDLVLAQRLELLLRPRGLGRSQVCARLGELRCRSHRVVVSAARGRDCRASLREAVRAIERTLHREIRNVRMSGACGQTPRKCRSARRPYAPQPGAASLLRQESTMMRTCRWNCGS